MTVIKNIKLPNEEITDIAIKDGTIEKIETNISLPNTKTIDANLSYALPLMIDLNITLRDNTLSIKNLDELEQRALSAGFSTVVTNVYIEEKTSLELLVKELKNRELNFILKVDGLNHEARLNNISILLKAGAKVIFENSDISTNNIRRLIQYALMHKTPLFVFCQNRALNDAGVMNEADMSFELGLPGMLKIGEISEVAKMASMSEYYKTPTLFQTISTIQSIQNIQNTKKNFKDLFTEVSIHHLLKTDDSCRDFNTSAKINPPLRGKEQQLSLLKALSDGKIDTLTSLFSPQSITNKDLPFEKAEFGIDEIEEFLPLAYTFLVKSGIISMEKLVELTSKNPAKILNIEENSLEVGKSAKFLLFNPNISKTYSKKNSIYFNDKIFGEITTKIS